MTNDEKVCKIAALLREMADEFGVSVSVRAVRKDEFYSADKFAVSIGESGGHGFDVDPCKALTEALADYERKREERELKAAIEAEFQQRRAQKLAA